MLRRGLTFQELTDEAFKDVLKKYKQPFFMQLADGDAELFAFAGLYDVWRGTDGQELYSYAILTTEATPQLAAVHARMPRGTRRHPLPLSSCPPPNNGWSS